jgi:hypothetical protein
MSGEEFAAWRALDSVSPLDLSERLGAMTATILANVHRDREQRPQGYTVEDMIAMTSIRQPERLTRREEEHRFRAAFQQAGLLVVRN